MLRKVLRRELGEVLHGFRFAVVLGLTVTLFAVSALVDATVARQAAEVPAGKVEGLTGEDGLTGLEGTCCSGMHARLLRAPLAFCAGRADEDLPDWATFFASELTALVHRGELEGALGGEAHLDWATVIAVILSFGAGVLTYRSVSGELQDGTLALVLSNPVSRAEVILGKYLAVLLSLAAALTVSMVLGLLVVRWLSPVGLGTGEWMRLAAFWIASILYLSCAVLIGLHCSVFGRNPVISAVTFLFAWAVLVFVVPNLGGVLVGQVRDTGRQLAIHGAYASVEQDLPTPPGADYAEGAARESQRAQERERLRVAYAEELVRQVELGRDLTRVSPAAAFLYSAEAVTGSGLSRLQWFVGHVVDYRRRLLQAVLEADSADENSEHVFHPFTAGQVNEATGKPWFSRDRVDLGPAKVFRDPPPNVGKAIQAATADLALLALYNGLLLVATIWRFVRQDVTPGSGL